MAGRIQRTVYTSALASVLLAVCALAMTTHAQEKRLTDFSSQDAEQAWRSVNDGVMGGVSEGRSQVTDEGTLLFTGNLSMENNGGFASIRTRAARLGLGGYDAIVVRAKGDGRTYNFDLRTDESRMASSYRTTIETLPNQWIEVSLPFDEFFFNSFGRQINREPLDPARVVGMGITLSDKNPGPFRLEIAYVKAVKQTANPSRVAGDEMAGDIVDVAAKAGQFKTLIAAVKAAGLVDVLKNPNATLTVFAPTDDAFAKLPLGTVESLLKPENKDQLIAVLTYHVLAEKVMLRRDVKTLQGGTLELTVEGAAKIGNANIVAADVKASNGVIHVIDTVLLPDLADPSPQQQARRVIELAINRGVPQFNAGNVAACAAIYEVAVTSLIAGHRDALSAIDIDRLNEALAKASQSESARDQAWVFRDAMDDVYASLGK